MVSCPGSEWLWAGPLAFWFGWMEWAEEMPGWHHREGGWDSQEHRVSVREVEPDKARVPQEPISRVGMPTAQCCDKGGSSDVVPVVWRW